MAWIRTASRFSQRTISGLGERHNESKNLCLNVFCVLKPKKPITQTLLTSFYLTSNRHLMSLNRCLLHTVSVTNCDKKCSILL